MNETTRRVLAHGFHRDCDLTLDEQGEGHAVCRFAVNDTTANPFGMLHGGILYGLMDVACFLAILPMLQADENAVSHDVHFSVLRPVAKGAEVRLAARIVQRGRRTAFGRVEAYSARDGDARLVAMGTVTKSIVPAA